MDTVIAGLERDDDDDAEVDPAIQREGSGARRGTCPPRHLLNYRSSCQRTECTLFAIDCC
jgi:hypothetical protein